MFRSKPKAKGSARTQIGIKEVRDGVLILPGNRYRTILATSSVNFELQSMDEQDAIIDTFQSFLNSLTSSVQILVRVRELDVERYLEDFAIARSSETEGLYKTQLKNYSAFIRKLVAGNKILSRRFYLIVSYDHKETADFSLIREQLMLEQEILVKGMEKMGMTARPLSSLEILDLFYSFYQPETAKTQPLAQALIRSAHVLDFP